MEEKRTVDLRLIDGRAEKMEYMVVFNLAYSLKDWCDDNEQTIVYKVLAENPMIAMTKAMAFFNQQVGSFETEYLQKDIIRVDIQRMFQVIQKRKSPPEKVGFFRALLRINIAILKMKNENKY